MDGVIRDAEPRDLAAIEALAEEKRAWYTRFQPTFWRPAADARAPRPFPSAALGERPCHRAGPRAR